MKQIEAYSSSRQFGRD